MFWLGCFHHKTSWSLVLSFTQLIPRYKASCKNSLSKRSSVPPQKCPSHGRHQRTSTSGDWRTRNVFESLWRGKQNWLLWNIKRYHHGAFWWFNSCDGQPSKSTVFGEAQVNPARQLKALSIAPKSSAWKPDEKHFGASPDFPHFSRPSVGVWSPVLLQVSWGCPPPPPSANFSNVPSKSTIWFHKQQDQQVLLNPRRKMRKYRTCLNRTMESQNPMGRVQRKSILFIVVVVPSGISTTFRSKACNY